MNMKILCILLASFGFLNVSGAQNTSAKLSANTVIGTIESVDYSTNNPSTTVNTKSNAFDGDMTTFFASYQRSGGWAGLDLGGKYVITKVAYCPRQDLAGRLLLGVFEGANYPDFGDAVPLCIITTTPSQNVMTEQMVSNSRGFRYVRYVGPNDVRCNIAEIEFYGYKDTGSNSALTRLANLPTVTIHTENAQDVIEKDVYLKGIVSFISADGTDIYTDSLEIKGRGNASWGFPKKPYRLKLSKKTRVLGLPANAKNWTLINNYGDKTLMRNLLAFDLSKRLDIPYTPAGIPVNVFLNGEYKGCYQLCDHIEVGKERVDIKEMKPEDITLPKLSGGYFIEIDAYASGELPEAWFTSASGIPVTIKSPKDDEIVPAQKQYISSYFNEMETVLFSSNFKDSITGYRKYIDVETFIRHFLVGEISGNTDTYWSTYMYKERESDIFKFGPVWDFDIAFENDNRTYPVNNHSDWIYKSGSAAGTARNIVNRLFEDTEFANRLKVVYAEYRNNENLTKDSLAAVVNNYSALLDDAQKLNFTRWNILNEYVHMNPRTYGSYAGEVDNVRSFLTARLDWVDKKLNYASTLNFDANGGTVSQDSKSIFYGKAVGTLPTPTYNNYTFSGWNTERNGSGDTYTEATIYNIFGNTTLYAQWGSTSISIEASDSLPPVLYPNPTTGIVHIDNTNGAEILLYGIFGELLHHTRDNRIDMSNYPNAVYLIKVGNKTTKVVKK
jgi:hypothetical protein